MKVLFANGCSMTYGSELCEAVSGRELSGAEREAAAWPGRLGHYLGAEEVVNCGEPSGSNDRIVRTTITWLLERFSRSGTKPEHIFVAIGWTSPMRREFYVDGAWRQIVPYHNHQPDKLDRLVRVYRETAWNDFECGIRFLTQVVALQSILKLHGVPYVFFDALSPALEATLAAGDNGRVLAQSIDRGRYMGANDANGCMADVLQNEAPKWNGKHPGQDGHDAWARRIGAFVHQRSLVTKHPADWVSPDPVGATTRSLGNRKYVY
jgi:lysophospholipase L1-like esterase